MTYDAVSMSKLSNVSPLLRAKVIAAMDALAQKGIFFRVAQGFRTYAEQDALFFSCHHADGSLDTSRKWVTNARGGQSNHNFGLAVDCYPFRPSKGVWSASVIYQSGDTVWFDGGVYVALRSGSLGNPPSVSISWAIASHPSGMLEMEDSSAPEFKAMVAALKAQGLAWGGDWKSTKDAPHFYLDNTPANPTSQDRVNFAQGGLTKVWESYGVATA